MNFIKAICEGKKADAYTHRQFTRFGKGDYRRFLLGIKKGKKLTIKSSFDYSGLFFSLIVPHLTENVDVKGKIIANYDFEDEIDAVKFSKRGKLYTAEINKSYSPKELQGLFEKFKMQYILLSFKSGDFKLKAKTSLPKPGGDLKDNFCSASFPLSFLDEFAFDFDHDFKQASIVHHLKIEDIIVPKELENDFKRAREEAIRKGKLIRKITLDGKEIEKEYALEV